MLRTGRAGYAVGVGAVVLIVAGLAAVVGERGDGPGRVKTGEVEIGLRAFVTVPRWAGPALTLSGAGDGSGRVFVGTRKGMIFECDEGGKLRERPFLDMREAGVRVLLMDEGGMCGMAFGPNFGGPVGTPGAGKFYTFTTEAYDPDVRVDFSHPEMKPGGTLTPADQVVVREWSVDPGEPDVADPASSRVVMRINHPQTTHHGGALAFGADGYLYVALGDGGGGNDKYGGKRVAVDGHTDRAGNAQDLSNVFGKVLRIDPLGTGSANGAYGVPGDNPFVGRKGVLGEIWAYGFRNPYRIGVDRETGAIYVGDVGQSQREEVDIVRRGGNYGWAYWEGTRGNTRASGTERPRGLRVVGPVVEYTHRDGVAVIGGVVYRGRGIRGLVGKYVFGDYLEPRSGGAGRLFYTGAGGGVVEEFRYREGEGLVGRPPEALLGFGEDDEGEVYALFDGGKVAKLVGVSAGPAGEGGF